MQQQIQRAFKILQLYNICHLYALRQPNRRANSAIDSPRMRNR